MFCTPVSFSISGMTALDAALPEKALRDQLKLAEHNWIQTRPFGICKHCGMDGPAKKK
jgi:hypothetical protein